MSLPTDPLELAILLHPFVQPNETHNRQVKLAFPLDTLNDALNFSAISTALTAASLLVEESSRRGVIEYLLPSDFFINLDELLIPPERRRSPPGVFYLLDESRLYRSSYENPSDKVNNYLAATKLMGLLFSIVDLEGGSGSEKTLIFLGKEKLEISMKYSISDLAHNINLAELESTYLNTENHKEQKKTIIRTVLFEMFSGRETVPFSDILNQFDEFMKKIHASYQLYVSEFSFEKVKEQIEKEKLDATMKLNKIFSDIQNQLLAVPAAVILAGGQMTQGESWNEKNISVWLGVVVLAIFMTMLIRNQRNTLQAVQKEIDQQWLQIEGKYHSVASRFYKSYEQLGDRYRQQEWLLKIVSSLVSLSLLVTTLLLLHYSVELPLLIKSLALGFSVALCLFVIEMGVYFYRKSKTKSDE